MVGTRRSISLTAIPVPPGAGFCWLWEAWQGYLPFDRESLSVKTLNTAVIGAGHLGRFHAQKYASLPGSRLLAVVDIDPRRAEAVAADHGAQAHSDYHAVLDQVDAVSIVVPAAEHFDIALACLQAGLHVLLEKPMTTTVEQADRLVTAASEHRCTLQIGLLERFNPAVMALGDRLRQPLFIESNRLFPFNPRGTDVSVVLDLMIHDIDLILQLVGADISAIDASGVQVLSDGIDIANARLRFTNGCVANVTASRVALKKESKMRVFQADSYLSIDFYQRRLESYARGGPGEDTILPGIRRERLDFEDGDILKAEIAGFLECIRDGSRPLVSGEDGRRALATALEISSLLTKSVPAVQDTQ